MEIIFRLTTEQLNRILIVTHILEVTVFGILFVYLKFSTDKRLKKFENAIGDTSELNRKIHDRLVAVEDCITRSKPIPAGLKQSLLMNASRLEKYDKKVAKDIRILISTWNGTFSSIEGYPGYRINDYEITKNKCAPLIEKIKSRVDNLVK